MTLLGSIPPLQKRRTKMVVTVGPACMKANVLRELLVLGVDVFRLNMSHGDHETHRQYYQMIRQQAQELQRNVSVLADLCGPKIRCGTFFGGQVELSDGDSVVLTIRDIEGDRYHIPSQYDGLTRDVQAGHRILLDDGLLELEVVSVADEDVDCRVIHGGLLRDHKGINLPDSSVSAAPLTDKDRRDATFAVDLGVDFLALSFVRKASDVCELRQWIEGQGTGIIAKIERPDALENAREIIQEADGIMVARGDLGVEIPAEQVPLAQRMLIDCARRLDKPVIVATQMLESMITHPRATRAEVTDVFHSVHDATDAVMLSAETAAGEYPVDAASTMDRIIRYAEGRLWQQSGFANLAPRQKEAGDDALLLNDALADAMAMLSRRLMVRAVVVFSPTGVTARTMAAARPEAPMLAVSPSLTVCRRLNMLWGVIPVQATSDEMQHPCQLAAALAQRFALATRGQTVLLVRGFHKEHAKNFPTVTIVCV